MTITTELTQRMRESAEKATGGEWHFDDNFALSVTSANLSELVILHARGSNGENDMRFIALCSPRNICLLLDALAAKDKQIAELTEWVNQAEARNNVKCAELCNQDEVIDSLRQSIAELEARPEQQPVAGYKLVPVDPTLEMRQAFLVADDEADSGDYDVCSPDHQWQAMLNAAPAAQPVTVKLPGCVDDLHGVGLVMSAEAVVESLTAAGITIAEGE